MITVFEPAVITPAVKVSVPLIVGLLFSVMPLLLLNSAAELRKRCSGR